MANITPEVLSYISATVSALAGSSQAWVWYDKKRRDQTIDSIIDEMKDISKTQIAHSNTFVTEEQTRKLLQEYFSKLEVSQAETSKNVKSIHEAVSKLTIQLEIMNAIKDYEKERSRNGE